jgi:chemotaxis protein CheD
MSVAAAATAPPAPGTVSEGGGGSRRIFDSESGSWVVRIPPGEYYVTGKKDEVIATILGSCVAACVRDPQKGIGGMNHFMLPQGGGTGSWGDDGQSTRYGNFAMEKLLNELIKAGCSRERLEIKVFGGGNVTNARTLIGTQNVQFVLDYLKSEGLPIAAQDLGGTLPRRIHYNPQNGRVVRRLMKTVESDLLIKEETDYQKSISSKKIAGDIELFGVNG